MKRSPLNRKTPLKKISKKRQAMMDREQDDRNAWIDDQGYFCWFCGATPAGYGMGSIVRIDTHEMVFLREHADAWQRPNYSRLCRPCHDRCHGREITLEMMIALKRIYDPKHYDLKPLQLMRATRDNPKRIDEAKIEEHYQRLLNQKGRRTWLKR